jgi:hypothetical protein
MELLRKDARERSSCVFILNGIRQRTLLGVGLPV